MLLVKDANVTIQSISTQIDSAGDLVPVHAPAAIAGGVATQVGAGGGPIPISRGALFITPSGCKPAGAVSLYASSIGHSFAARRW
jgi:hypothetical protein